LSKLEYEWWLDESVASMLNFLKLITIIIMLENFLILRKYALKNLRVEGHDICNFLSNGSGKNRSQALWYMLAIPALRRQRWEDLEFEPILGYIASSRPACPT
jgi:hypothetical protein